MAIKFSFYFILCLFISSTSCGFDNYQIKENSIQWNQFEKLSVRQEKRDYRNGFSYIISGSLALIGGILGAQSTSDNLEKGVYTLFQTIGIASIGFGVYTWKIGEEDRNLYHILNSTSLNTDQKTMVLRSYYNHKKLVEKEQRFIKAVTHSLISGINFYSASKQKHLSVKNGLNFIGGVNLLAALSYTIEF